MADQQQTDGNRTSCLRSSTELSKLSFNQNRELFAMWQQSYEKRQMLFFGCGPFSSAEMRTRWRARELARDAGNWRHEHLVP